MERLGVNLILKVGKMPECLPRFFFFWFCFFNSKAILLFPRYRFMLLE